MRSKWLVVFVALAMGTASADENPLGMSYIDTSSARLIYFDSLDFLAPHAAQTFTNSMAWQKERFGWVPSESVTVLLKDAADYGNAHALVAPHTRLIFDVAPESHAFETNTASERFYSTMNHELIHLVQGDISSSQDRYWRSIFMGKVSPQAENPETILYNYLTVPRFTAPRWYIEGGAVFMETWMSGGLGRAQGGYDEMVFRAMVRDDVPFYDPLGLVSKGIRSDFQVGANAYLYGTRFMTWLAYRYTPEKVVAWIRRDEDSRRYYSDQFEHVFGVPLEQAWQEWIAFERDFQRKNLEEVRKHPITPHNPLVNQPIGSISRVYLDESRSQILAGFRVPGIVDHVGVLDLKDGNIKRLADIKRAMLYRVTSFAYDKSSRTAFYTNDNLKKRDLMSVNLDTGEETMLLEDARIGEIVVNPVDKSLIGVRHSRGIATLVRIPVPYDDWDDIHQFPYEHVPYDLDISSDGKLLSASVGELSGDQFLRVWKLEEVLAGKMKPISEYKFGQSVPESFVFSPDSRYLYGSSYYTGVSNIFRYEVATGDVVAVSNAEIGFFRPVPMSDGRLLVLTYSGAGFLPATIAAKPIDDVSATKFLGAELAEKYPVVTTWQVPPPSKVDVDKEIVDRGHFVPLKSMSVENAFPVFQGYKDSIGLGYHVNFSDTLGFSKLGLTTAYTPSNDYSPGEHGHIELTGEYLSWRGSLAINRSDFYDIFGPTKLSRKGFAAKLGYDDLLIYDDPRSLTLKYDFEYVSGIDTLPEAQNVGSSVSRMLTAGAGLYYSNVRRSLGAVDDEKGLKLSLAGSAAQMKSDVVPQVVGTVDAGYPLPFAHSSVWFRGAVGASGGARSNPEASFYFGGFGNNYVDSREIKRYHEYGTLPGFEIDQISGQTFAKATLELNLPPVIFGTAGLPAFHATWLRPSIFATTLSTNPDDASLRQTHKSVGAQADIRFSVLHWSDLTLSFGFAQGWQGSRRAGNEFMVSLKIL